MKRYSFDGQMLTQTEIHKRIPCVSPRQIARYLEKGINTQQAMTSQFKIHPKPGPRSQFVIGKSPTFERVALSKMR
jgi:hypothetical protein